MNRYFLPNTSIVSSTSSITSEGWKKWVTNRGKSRLRVTKSRAPAYTDRESTLQYSSETERA